MRQVLIKIIKFYRKFISPMKSPSCVFYPTCSLYTIEAIEKYGAVKGVYLSVRRILRCHPWQKNQIDLVP